LVAWGRSLCEPLVSQSLAGNGFNEAVKPHQGMILYVPLIQPEGKFVNITAKMFAAGMMINTDQTALKDGEHAFNSVCGDGAAHIFASAVIDRFVPGGGVK
jgi:hypothetical protein